MIPAKEENYYWHFVEKETFHCTAPLPLLNILSQISPEQQGERPQGRELKGNPSYFLPKSAQVLKSAQNCPSAPWGEDVPAARWLLEAN